MFLRRIERRKNGKTHLYWSVVENKRLHGGGVVQRHVLYLGEINSSQAEVWRKAIEVFDADAGSSRTLALFPEDRCEVAVDDASVVRLRISEMRLHRPRQWGACWLAGLLWRELQLDRFWAERQPTGAPLSRTMQAHFRNSQPHHRGVVHRDLATVLREQGQRPRAARVRVEHLDRLAPHLRLGRIDLAQIQNVPLHHPAAVETLVLDEAPI